LLYSVKLSLSHAIYVFLYYIVCIGFESMTSELVTTTVTYFIFFRVNVKELEAKQNCCKIHIEHAFRCNHLEAVVEKLR